jgi:hypothetical protein
LFVEDSLEGLTRFEAGPPGTPMSSPMQKTRLSRWIGQFGNIIDRGD